MDKLDRLIEEALSQEDRHIIEETRDPGLPQLGMTLFRGPRAWAAALASIFQVLLFFVGVWAAWKFFNSDDMLTAIKYGIPAATAVLASGQVKFSMYGEMHANRVIREVKRLELIVAGMRNGKDT